MKPRGSHVDWASEAQPVTVTSPQVPVKVFGYSEKQNKPPSPSLHFSLASSQQTLPKLWQNKPGTFYPASSASGRVAGKSHSRHTHTTDFRRSSQQNKSEILKLQIHFSWPENVKCCRWRRTELLEHSGPTWMNKTCQGSCRGETCGRGTHGVSYLQVGTLPEAWQRLPVLAGGGEGKADVLRVVPHRQLHLRADVLRRQNQAAKSGGHPHMVPLR